MHDILDDFTNKVKEEKIAWSELSKEKCSELVNKIVDKKLQGDSNSILNSTKISILC